MANAFRSRLGAGGGVYPTGNAQPADVLAGKTFSNAEGIDKTGTMVNNGAISGTVAPGASYTVPEGYHNGSGVVSATNFELTSGSAATTNGTTAVSLNVNVDDIVLMIVLDSVNATDVTGLTILNTITTGGATPYKVNMCKATSTTVSFKTDYNGVGSMLIKLS